MEIYRDREGDLWSRGDCEPGQGAFLAVAPDYRWEGPTGNTLGDANAVHGPLVRLEDPDPLLPIVTEGLGKLIDYLAGRRADH